MLNHFLRRYIPIGITLILGAGLSIVAAIFVERWESSNSQIQFQRQIENLATALQRSSNRYIDILISISDYYAAARLQIERRDFNQFVQRSLKSYPSIQALEWAPVVKNSDRLTYEQQMRATGYRQFQITELTDAGVLRTGESLLITEISQTSCCTARTVHIHNIGRFHAKGVRDIALCSPDLFQIYSLCWGLQ